MLLFFGQLVHLCAECLFPLKECSIGLLVIVRVFDEGCRLVRLDFGRFLSLPNRPLSIIRAGCAGFSNLLNQGLGIVIERWWIREVLA